MKNIHYHLLTQRSLGNTTLKIMCAMLVLSCGCSPKTTQVVDKITEDNSKIEPKDGEQLQDSTQNEIKIDSDAQNNKFAQKIVSERIAAQRDELAKKQQLADDINKRRTLYRERIKTASAEMLPVESCENNSLTEEEKKDWTCNNASKHWTCKSDKGCTFGGKLYAQNVYLVGDKPMYDNYAALSEPTDSNRAPEFCEPCQDEHCKCGELILNKGTDCCTTMDVYADNVNHAYYMVYDKSTSKWKTVLYEKQDKGCLGATKPGQIDTYVCKDGQWVCDKGKYAWDEDLACICGDIPIPSGVACIDDVPAYNGQKVATPIPWFSFKDDQYLCLQDFGCNLGDGLVCQYGQTLKTGECIDTKLNKTEIDKKYQCKDNNQCPTGTQCIQYHDKYDNDSFQECACGAEVVEGCTICMNPAGCIEHKAGYDIHYAFASLLPDPKSGREMGESIYHIHADYINSALPNTIAFNVNGYILPNSAESCDAYHPVGASPDQVSVMGSDEILEERPFLKIQTTKFDIDQTQTGPRFCAGKDNIPLKSPDITKGYECTEIPYYLIEIVGVRDSAIVCDYARNDGIGKLINAWKCTDESDCVCGGELCPAGAVCIDEKCTPPGELRSPEFIKYLKNPDSVKYFNAWNPESLKDEKSVEGVCENVCRCGDAYIHAGSECLEGKRVAESSQYARYEFKKFTPRTMTYDDASGKWITAPRIDQNEPNNNIKPVKSSRTYTERDFNIPTQAPDVTTQEKCGDKTCGFGAKCIKNQCTCGQNTRNNMTDFTCIYTENSAYIGEFGGRDVITGRWYGYVCLKADGCQRDGLHWSTAANTIGNVEAEEDYGLSNRTDALVAEVEAEVDDTHHCMYHVDGDTDTTKETLCMDGDCVVPLKDGKCNAGLRVNDSIFGAYIDLDEDEARVGEPGTTIEAEDSMYNVALYWASNEESFDGIGYYPIFDTKKCVGGTRWCHGTNNEPLKVPSAEAGYYCKPFPVDGKTETKAWVCGEATCTCGGDICPMGAACIDEQCLPPIMK